MPDPWAGHSEKKWEWDTGLTHSEEVRRAVADDPEPAPQGRSRKSTRDWCKGRKGTPHEPVLELTRTAHGQPGTCRWQPVFSWREKDFTLHWRCAHQEVCARCGKILRDGYGGWRDKTLALGECPVFPGTQEDWWEARDKAQASTDRYRAWWRTHQRKPAAGPSHYRKPKARS
jgi:hypothetical protein